MQKRTALILCLVLIFFGIASAKDTVKNEAVTASVQLQHESVLPGGESAIAITFELKKDWHFYASAKTAPGQMNLKIKPSAEPNDLITFAEPVFPKSELYFDKLSEQKLHVFSHTFTVYVPFTVSQTEFEGGKASVNIDLDIKGAICSDVQCRMPSFKGLGTEVKIDSGANMDTPRFVVPARVAVVDEAEPVSQWGGYSLWFAICLALLAGLSLNIMPCIWPILPIIIMRIVEQAKKSHERSITMGSAFCIGILLFFACLAGANIILQLFYGTVLQWGDQFRNPGFVAGMALLLVVLALFMFGLFAVTLPAAISGKTGGSGKGFASGIGMGFLAAVLSTPCSFAILAAAFAWAQSQPLALATIGIMVIGVGMAIPYLILASMPKLLNRLPKAGNWMELFKQAIGFVLLAIAIKLFTALPQERLAGALYFAVVLSFSFWMLGGWVQYGSKPSRVWLVRIMAIALSVAAGWTFLPAPKASLIDWHKYDTAAIDQAKSEDRAVLIKFTATWCLSCQVVEKTVYANEDIAGLLKEKNVLVIKADTTTREMPATLALKNIYNEPGVPVSMLFLPGKNKPVKWRSMNFTDELKELLEEIEVEEIEVK